MDINSLQYLMGHSDAGVTMNVYTHTTYDHAEATMQKILQLQLPEGERKTGWHTNNFLTPNLHHLAEKLRELIHHYKIYQLKKVRKSDFDRNCQTYDKNQNLIQSLG